MSNYGECEFCGNRTYLEKHHVFFGTGLRKLSEKHNMTCMLCHECHRTGKIAVHNNRTSDLLLKKRFQARFEKTHSREDFMKIFRRNYLVNKYE